MSKHYVNKTKSRKIWRYQKVNQKP